MVAVLDAAPTEDAAAAAADDDDNGSVPVVAKSQWQTGSDVADSAAPINWDTKTALKLEWKSGC